MDRQMSESLDRHITGNYGEDQFAECVKCATCNKEISKEETIASLVHDHKRKFFCTFKCANAYLNRVNKPKEPNLKERIDRMEKLLLDLALHKHRCQYIYIEDLRKALIRQDIYTEKEVKLKASNKERYPTRQKFFPKEKTKCPKETNGKNSTPKK